jgi:hypothetical protein
MHGFYIWKGHCGVTWGVIRTHDGYPNNDPGFSTGLFNWAQCPLYGTRTSWGARTKGGCQGKNEKMKTKFKKK